MIAVLIGEGPNDVEIPAMIFPDFETGLRFVIEQLGRGPSSRSGNVATWKVSDREPALFYTHYYDGCGECWRLRLQEQEFAQPFVAFDLD